MTIQDSFLADNAKCGINVKWTDKLQIQDTKIIGYTQETKDLVKPPYFRKPCISSGFTNTPSGLRMPTAIRSWNREDNVGANLTNLHFMNFNHSDECASSIPLHFRVTDENRFNHFEYATFFKNVTIDGEKIMDTLASDQEGIKNIIIHDFDGSSDPLGQAIQGMLVSNKKYLTIFSNSTCIRYPEGASYCADECYRTVSLFIDQTDSDKFDLRVT